MLTSFVETTDGHRKGFVESPVFARNGSLALPTLKYLEATTTCEPSHFTNNATFLRMVYSSDYGGGWVWISSFSAIGPTSYTHSEGFIELGRTFQRRTCTLTLAGADVVRDETHAFRRDEWGRSEIDSPATTEIVLYCQRDTDPDPYVTTLEYSWQPYTDTWGACRNLQYGYPAGFFLPDGWYGPQEAGRVGCVDVVYSGTSSSGTWGNMTCVGPYGIGSLSYSYNVRNLEEDDYDALYQSQIDYLDTINSTPPSEWAELTIGMDAAGGTRIDVFPVFTGTAGGGFVFGGWTQSAWGRNHKRFWIFNSQDVRLDYVKVTAPTVFLAGHDGTGDYHLEDAAGMAVIRCEPGVSNPGDVVRSPDWTGTVVPQALTDYVVAMPGFAAVLFGVTPEQAAEYVLSAVPAYIRQVYRVEIV